MVESGAAVDCAWVARDSLVVGNTKRTLRNQSGVRSFGHISRMSEVVRTFAATEVGQEGADATAKAALRPLVGLAQTCLQLAEGHLHRIEVR